MKKLSKIISIFMAAVIALSVFAVITSAIATELTAGNTKETATNIPSFGTEYVSTLSKAGEQDWFKFTTLSEDAYYTISLENYNIAEDKFAGLADDNVHLFVYDLYNKQLVDIISTSSTNIKLEKNITYYIKIAMGSSLPESTGNYEILISYKLDPVSNIKEEATTIKENNTYKYSLDGTGDVDWFKFIASADNVYKITLQNYDIPEGGYVGLADDELHLFVYDLYNKQLVNICSTNSADIKLEKNTAYYIKVVMGSTKPYATGNYGFSINCDSIKSLSKITIDSLPTKTTYKVGESFDKAGLAVTAHYSDGSTKAVTSCTVFGFDSSTTGAKELTISYTENGVTKTATFDVSITEDGAAPTPGTNFDFAAIFSAIWEFFVGIFNFILSLFM